MDTTYKLEEFEDIIDKLNRYDCKSGYTMKFYDASKTLSSEPTRIIYKILSEYSSDFQYHIRKGYAMDESIHKFTYKSKLTFILKDNIYIDNKKESLSKLLYENYNGIYPQLERVIYDYI